MPGWQGAIEKCILQDMAFSLATIYISFSLLICGFYIRIEDMTLSIARGLSWASFPKYAFQGLARTELVNRVWDANSCTPVETGELVCSPIVVYSMC